MREPLLFIPPLSVSPATAELIGGPRAAFDELRPRFELDVFTWPCIKGGADVPPTWEVAARLIREALSPGCHVIAAGDAVWLAFLAIGEAPVSVRSVTCGAPGIPDATLRALGDSSLAEASTLTYTTGQHARGLGAALSAAAATRLRADLDLARYEALMASWESINLLEEQPLVTAPCLFLEDVTGTDIFAEGESRDLVTRFAPNTTVRPVTKWGVAAHVEDRESAKELTSLFFDFVRSLPPDSRA
jgi:hypothetical protein